MTRKRMTREEMLTSAAAIARNARALPRDRVAAMALVARLERYEEKDGEPMPDFADDLEAKRWRLADIRRRIPRQDGIAYSQLVDKEEMLSRAIADEEEKRRKAETARANMDARISAFRDELLTLPETVRRRIREVVLAEVPDE